jgi:integrase
MMARKRNAGEGSIFQRADRRWCGQIDLGWRDGKRIRKTVYGTTADAVLEKMEKLTHDRRLGLLPASGSSPTVERFLKDWLASVKSSLRVRSYEAYNAIVENHLTPEIGRIKLEKLTPMHIQRLLDSKLEAGLSPRSVSAVKIVLGAALKQAVRWQMVARNVAYLVAGPRVRSREMRVLSPEHARTFLTASEGEPLHALYFLALSTGLRRGELLAVKWEDVDFEKATLSVRRSLGRSQTAGIVIDEPKTTHGRRTLHLSAPVISVLRLHRKAQLERRLLAGPKWHDAGYIFTTGVGTSLDPGVIGDDFARILAKAQLEPIRFHDLRHSAATIALSQGVHPKIVSEMLGHSRISLTLDVYSHSLPTLQAEAADKIAAALATR